MVSKDELDRKEAEALVGGGQARIDKQHAAGKLTARERIAALVDPGTFQEFDKFVTHRSENFGLGDKKFLGDGVVTGTAQVDGRQIFLFAQDFTVFGGSLAEMHARKIVKMMELAERTGAPIVGLNDSGGARIQEGVESLGGYADIFLRNVLMSGVVPQFSLIMGPCAGGAVYSPAITDFVMMVENTSHMFITGPDVIKAVTKEEVDKELLGGAATHSSISGVAHITAPTDAALIESFKALFSFVPQNNLEKAPNRMTMDLLSREEESLDSLIPESPNQPYDIKRIISAVADENCVFEIQPTFAANIVTAFIRVGGNSVGVIANQPMVLAGCLDINASIKAARFVRFCDAFNIPLLTLVDVPGFLPGVNQEHGGIIKHGAKLLYAYAEATVPKVTVITRKAYGGAYDVMSSKHLRGDVNLAFPSAEVAVMGSDGAVNIIFRQELDAAAARGELDQVRAKLLAEYRSKFVGPWAAASIGFIDMVIRPRQIRAEVARSLEMLRSKCVTNPRKKHGNIPL